MSEIEKMYENAIGKVCTHTIINPERCNKRRMTRCCGCDWLGYPPFTAEKQLKIVKQILFSTWWMNLKRLQFSEKFDEGLAQMINELWQYLTEEEKQQVKGILE